MHNQIYNLVKRKRITPIIFTDYLHNNNIDIESIKNYKNSWGESILTYSIKYGSNIPFFEFLYQNGFSLTGNYYEMTPIDICVAYNKNTSQKLSILDWLYNKNIQFNPFFLLVYPRYIIMWLRNRDWRHCNIDINRQNSIGNTALHEVCKLYHHHHPLSIYNKVSSNNSYDAFYLILEMGGDPSIQNNCQNTPIDYCLKNSFINNLNILYYFHYEISPTQIKNLIDCDYYFRLVKHTLWLLTNYKILNTSFTFGTKLELENNLLEKIVTMVNQKKEPEDKIDNSSILKDLNNKLFFDEMYNLQMFYVDENMFF